MPDTVTVTSSKSWFSRVLGAFAGVLVGLALIVASFPLIWWNEGRAVHRLRSLQEGASVVVDAAPDTVSPANEGKLVHLSGLATTDETLTDTDFGISAQAIRLSRIAETYQWAEHSSTKKRKKLGGGEETTTTYTYSKEWAGQRVDSSGFKSPSGHENPASLQWVPYSLSAQRVSLGAFTLPPDVASKIEGAQPRPAQASDVQSMAAEGFRQVEPGKFFKGRNPSDPQVGDVRVRYEVVLPQTISLVAVQRGSTFEAFHASAGSDVLLVEPGSVPAGQMFKAAIASNRILTWVLRVAGFLAMFLGFVLVLRPISVLGSVIPILGSLLGAGTGLIAFLVALTLSFTTMALAWLAYRPLLGGGLLVLAAASIALLVRAHRKTKPVVTPPAVPPAAPPPVVPPPIPPIPKA
jgi:hypothetical protein